MANFVKFGFGVAEKYNAGEMAGMIYFATDTQEIFLDGVSYGYSAEEGQVVEGSIKSLELLEDQKTIKITFNSGGTTNLVLKEATTELPGLMSATDKAALDTLNGDEETEGSVKKQVADLKEELEGELAKATVASEDKTVTVTPGEDGTDLSVNIDGTTIVADPETGELSVAPAATAVTGKDAIKVTEAEGKQVELVIATANKVLTQSAAGLDTTLGLKFVKASDNTGEGANTGKAVVQLVGVGGEVLSEFDASDLVMDGVLDTVELEEGILTFTWNAAAGKSATTINLGDYIKPYSNGDGLNLNGQVFSVKVKEGDKYLTVGADGVASKGIDEAITAAVDELDANVDSTGGTKVKVNVVEEDGKVKTVTVTETDVASAAELTQLVEYLTWYEAD